jgi:hypothetical protein
MFLPVKAEPQSIAKFFDFDYEFGETRITSMNGKTPLKFTAKAKATLEYFRDIGRTEVTCYGVINKDLIIEDFIIPKQECCSVSIDIDTEDLSDKAFEVWEKDKSMDFWRTTSVWIHTHPGTSASPSTVDETQWKEQCEKVENSKSESGGIFIMYILAKGGEEYCRMKIKGVDTTISVPVEVVGEPYELSDQEKEKIDQAYKECVNLKTYNVAKTATNTTSWYNQTYGNYQHGHGGYYKGGKYKKTKGPKEILEDAENLVSLSKKLVKLAKKKGPGVDKLAKEIEDIASDLWMVNDTDYVGIEENQENRNHDFEIDDEVFVKDSNEIAIIEEIDDTEDTVMVRIDSHFAIYSFDEISKVEDNQSVEGFSINDSVVSEYVGMNCVGRIKTLEDTYANVDFGMGVGVIPCQYEEIKLYVEDDDIFEEMNEETADYLKELA